MTKTIVVPLDGSAISQRALEPAAWLATRLGADLHLVTTTFSADPSTEVAFLKASADLVPLEHVTSEVIGGAFPSSGVVSAVQLAPEGMLVMSTRGRGGAGRLLLGSVSDEILSRTTVPVVLVGPSCEPIAEGAAHLVVGIEDEPTAEAIVPVASAWAAKLGLSAHFVHVLGRHEGTASDELRDAWARRTGAFKAQGVHATYNVVGGDTPADGILYAAADRPTALLCMLTHSRTGLRSSALGPVTTDVVRHARQPVLVLPVGD
jgi:nucleotide-binding universal stress UspA family protein